MINYTFAREIFESYLNDYDRTDDKVRLKIVHTYGVVGQAAGIARRMRLSDEDTELAKLIALLHDLGRFEQLRRFDSFEPDTMDHAAYGVQVVLKRYRELGGELITVGSDAHRAQDVASAFDKAGELLEKCGFKYYTVYNGRIAMMKKL